jgi:hypothetical protein
MTYADLEAAVQTTAGTSEHLFFCFCPGGPATSQVSQRSKSSRVSPRPLAKPGKGTAHILMFPFDSKYTTGSVLRMSETLGIVPV